MPKQTFFNLEEEKRQNIIRSAVEEFAGFPYERASLSQIVAKAGISKGSMYQYFQDKLDLYLYIVELAYEQKKNYVDLAFELEGDAFAVLEEYYRQSLLFFQDHPELHQVTSNFWGSQAQALQTLHEEGKVSRAKDFNEVLEDVFSFDSVNFELDRAAVFFVYHAVGKALIDHFQEGMEQSFVKEVLDVLRYGLQKRGEGQE